MILRTCVIKNRRKLVTILKVKQGLRPGSIVLLGGHCFVYQLILTIIDYPVKKH